MKMYEFDWYFTDFLLQASIGSDNGLAPMAPHDGLVYWRIYASLGLNELTKSL